ncbi:uncharacterized protein LOC134822119 [Bolinopsis microptera]|uniref:uncharacterized protein LOC134822119 n=1 Tax=Bolinopsis microptera TaxID=2820187 RepID=UPI00307942A7
MRGWVTSLLLFVISCYHGYCLTDEELKVVRDAVINRPNLVINGIQLSQLEMKEENAGRLSFRTNSKPGYIEPDKSGYPVDKDVQLNIPKFPMYGDRSSCLPTGEPVGITILGTLIYSVSLALPGCPQADEPVIGDGIPDGVKEPDFDECGGQVGENRTYRVYTWSDCFETLTCSEPSGMIGVALDGYPIYGPIDETGRQLTTADLDECHGKVSDGQYRYHATVDYPYFISCFKGIVPEDVGIRYPIKCTCPYDDTPYIDPDRIPFPNYTIAYEWTPIYRNLSLYPCQLCSGVRKYNTAFSSDSWLNYNKVKQIVQVCNITTDSRFTDVIKRRLTQGRLPPDKEYNYFRSLSNPHDSYFKENTSPKSKSDALGLTWRTLDFKANFFSILWAYVIYCFL